MTCLPFDFISGFKLYAGPCPDPQLSILENLQIKTAAILLDPTFCDFLRERYIQHRIQQIYCPIPDFGVPKSTKAINRFIKKVFKALEKGNVYLHCLSGRGRTGMIVACISVLKKGLSGDQAISFTRSIIRGAIETEPQERFILQFSRDYGLFSSSEQKISN